MDGENISKLRPDFMLAGNADAIHYRWSSRHIVKTSRAAVSVSEPIAMTVAKLATFSRHHSGRYIAREGEENAIAGSVARSRA
jgi:hypothetical protein